MTINYRYDWLSEIINEKGFKDIAEVGLNNCETLHCLMQRCPQIKHYLGVDKITNKPIEDCVNGFRDKFTFIKGDSTEVGITSDRKFDLVFIDADHSKEKVLLDIKAWEDKVKSGGILCGDDYGNIHWPGVKEAVDEYFQGSELNSVGDPANIWWVNK